MKKLKILIVEDDTWQAEQYRRILEKNDFKTDISPHALDAIEKIDDYKPDVIIMDILLTGSTAFALMNELQSYGDTSKTPIIICSSIGESLDIDNLKQYGVRRILDKAVMHPEDLVAAIRSVSE